MAGKKLSDSEEKVRYYHAKYVSYSRAIGVMWAVLTVCFAIIVIVSLVQPRWIGATSQSRSGFFGLYQYCTDVSVDSNTYTFKCNGRFLDFSQIPSGAYVAATVLVGIAVLVALVCVLLFVLFFFIPSAKVYYACFWLQLVCATLLFLACVIYPSGWSSNEVRNLCSGATGYSLGPTCSVQWAFILAIIGIFDAIVLAVLAFILATKQARLLSWEEEPKCKRRRRLLRHLRRRHLRRQKLRQSREQIPATSRSLISGRSRLARLSFPREAASRATRSRDGRGAYDFRRWYAALVR